MMMSFFNVHCNNKMNSNNNDDDDDDPSLLSLSFLLSLFLSPSLHLFISHLLSMERKLLQGLFDDT